MAGALTISTLKDSSGVLATQNGMTGIAKAWVNFNGTGTVAIRSSFNVSSITDNGTGDYTVNFTTAMPDANYAATALARVNGNTLTLAQFKNGGSQTTTTFSLATYTSAPALVDASEVYFVVNGN
jgi:hypothetical protein